MFIKSNGINQFLLVVAFILTSPIINSQINQVNISERDAEDYVMGFYNEVNDEIRKERSSLTSKEWADILSTEKLLWNNIQSTIKAKGSYSAYLENNKINVLEYKKLVLDKLTYYKYNDPNELDIQNSTPVINNSIDNSALVKGNSVYELKDYTDVIKDFLKAEDSRNFSKIYTFYAPEIKQYWSILNPSYEILKQQYEKAWRYTYDSSNTVDTIVKLDKNTYYLNTYFSYYDNRTGGYKKTYSRVRFVLDDNGKIVEVGKAE